MDKRKFKVWDDLDKKFSKRDFFIDQDGDLVRLPDYGLVCSAEGYFKEVPCSPYVDSNDEELYLNDIVSIKNKSGRDEHGLIVQMDSGEWVISLILPRNFPLKEAYVKFDDMSVEFIKIGNSYENPELLEIQ